MAVVQDFPGKGKGRQGDLERISKGAKKVGISGARAPIKKRKKASKFLL